MSARSSPAIEPSRPLEAGVDVSVRESAVQEVQKQEDHSEDGMAFVSAATLQALPPDLKERVLYHLHDIRSHHPPYTSWHTYHFGQEVEGDRHWRRLAQTCRAWRQLIRPRLYDDFSLQDLRKKSLAQLAAFAKDRGTLELVRVIRVNLCCKPRSTSPEDKALFPAEIVRSSAYREETELHDIIDLANHLAIIFCERLPFKKAEIALDVLPSIYLHPNLTNIRAAGPASRSLCAALAQIIRFSQDVRSIIPVPKFWEVEGDEIADESARAELMQAAALRTELEYLRLSDLCVSTAPSTRRFEWCGSLLELHVGLEANASGTAAPLIESLMRSQHATLEKLVIGRKYLATAGTVLDQRTADRSLRRLRVEASDPLNPFGTDDLDELSTVALEKLSLRGEGSAALAAVVLNSKACKSLKKIKMRGDVTDKAKLRTVRDIVRERTGLVATWNKKRLEDLDLS